MEFLERQMPLSPMVLSAQITIAANRAAGEIGFGNTTQLENPFQAPMWLEEIRVSYTWNSSDTSEVDEWAGFGLKLELGKLPITNGFVPLPLFGKVLSDSVLNVGSGASNDTTLSRMCFTWKLPRPLFIEARQLLKPTLYVPTMGSVAKTVTLSYHCRPLPKGTPSPKMLQVPWVTSYKPANLALGGSDQTDFSAPSDLFNPWNEELHVQRFLGRFLVIDDNSELDGSMTVASAQINLTTGALVCGTLITAEDSFNNILIRDRTPFAHVFDAIDRAWTVNCICPPKGFYLFTIDRLWSGAPTQPTTATVGISMVGWREVAYGP